MENFLNDDGSLAFLKIPRDENNRSFCCDETTQSKLVNTTFWVVDFIEDVPTRFSKSKGTKGQTLVKRKRQPTAQEMKREIAPWLGWCQHSNSRNLLRKILKPDYHESILRH